MSSKQQANRHTIGSGDTGYDMIQAWAATTADLHPKDLEPASVPLQTELENRELSVS